MSNTNKVAVENIEKEIMKYLQECKENIEDEVKEIADETTKEACKELKQISPKASKTVYLRIQSSELAKKTFRYQESMQVLGLQLKEPVNGLKINILK